MKPEDIQLVIFDCDGVLINSEILSRKVLLGLLENKGVSVDEAYFNAHFLGRTFESVTQQVFDDFSVVLDEGFREQFRLALFDTFSNELEVTEGIKSILSELNKPYCVATSSSPARVGHALEVTALKEFFGKKVFTASLVKQGKPAPDIFLYSAEKMGFKPSECLVIEDSISGLKAGLAANMQVVQYNGAGHMQHLNNEALIDSVSVVSSWAEFKSTFSHLFN